MVALEALAPELIESATIRFDGTPLFRMDITRMRGLTDSVIEIAIETPGEAGEAGPPPMASRAEAERFLAGVEAYFRTAEPSSPIPMLLAKARQYLRRDFLFILKDLTDSRAEEG